MFKHGAENKIPFSTREVAGLPTKKFSMHFIRLDRSPSMVGIEKRIPRSGAVERYANSCRLPNTPLRADFRAEFHNSDMVSAFPTKKNEELQWENRTQDLVAEQKYSSLLFLPSFCEKIFVGVDDD
jgi:hypothetical protein